MEILATIEIDDAKPRRIELLRGDLTAIPPEHAFDLLVVSAFPSDYIPTATSLIGALHRKGLSVAQLAEEKELDLRANFSCWLSRAFTPSDPKLRFKRLLVFEPLVRGRPPEVVGDIYRALTPILGERSDISTIAMPILAAGDQSYSVDEMLVPLVDATIHWLETGLPLTCVKIVAYGATTAQVALKTFSKVKVNRDPAPSVPATNAEYDVFISYAHENKAEMEALERQLLREEPMLNIFLDRKEIDIGSPWQPEIFESLDRCRKVVPLFSPDYLNSKVCKEEFNIAWIRSRETEQTILFPVYLYSADLPTYMRYRSYFDCREGDLRKIRTASKRLIADLELGSPKG